MKRFLLAALLCLWALPGLRGGDPPKPPPPAWDPVAPEIWAMKDPTLPGGMGAVILERRLQVTNTRVVNQLRIRICSDRGRSAAELGALYESTRDLRGRVVYPDGTELAFDSEKDLHTKFLAQIGRYEVKGKVLVPPGITEDCLLDVRWEEPRYWNAFYRWRQAFESWDLATPYPTSSLTVEIGKDSVFMVSLIPGATLKMARSDTPEFSVFKIRDIPAALPMPFALRVTRDIPRLKVYTMPFQYREALGRGGKSIWETFAQITKNFYTEGISAGTAFVAFSDALRKDLPAGSQARAQEIAFRLQGRIKNLDHLTREESKGFSKKELEAALDPKDMDALVKRGYGHTNSIDLLFLKLLQGADVVPKLIYVPDRERELFHLEEGNPTQLVRVLMAIDEPGKPRFLLDPAARFAPPTLILPKYQAVTALELDTVRWTLQTWTIVSQPASTNVRRDTYRLDLLPDQDHFTLESTFQGFEDFAARTAFMDLDPLEQNCRLREQVEDAFRATVDRAEVLNARDAQQGVLWKVEGRLDRAVGRHRCVQPFPITPLALDVPKDLPDARTELIVMPYLMEHQAICRFKVPHGYRFSALAPFSESNEFGSVALKAEQAEGPDGAEVTATLTVRVERAISNASTWPTFLKFLGWIQTAHETRLILEKRP